MLANIPFSASIQAFFFSSYLGCIKYVPCMAENNQNHTLGTCCQGPLPSAGSEHRTPVPTRWQQEETLCIIYRQAPSPVTITWMPGATQIMPGFSVDTGSEGREKTAPGGKSTSWALLGLLCPGGELGTGSPRRTIALGQRGSLLGGGTGEKQGRWAWAPCAKTSGDQESVWS